MKHVTIVAGTRPNFIKIAPLIKEIEAKKNRGFDINFSLIHTGQHYDKKMSMDFFEQLDIPDPNLNLNAGGGTQAEQTAKIMIGFEKYLFSNNTDLVLVVGDVNSTMACAIVAQKAGIEVAHVEAGIRSHDWTMPEEINRLITDSITNYFFTTSETANNNLISSGVKKENIFFVGNTMIDTLLSYEDHFIQPEIWDKEKLSKRNYIVLTLHRPGNVDEKEKLRLLISEIIRHSNRTKLIFPVHPRTRKIIDEMDISHERLIMIDPLSYLEFNFLVKNSFAVITDSGGITEETTVFNIPCLTLRDNTERPETVDIGTNELVGTNPENISSIMRKLYEGRWKKGRIPELWDGKTADRIISKIIEL